MRGRFFIAHNVPLESKADNSIVASTSATTLADHSPSSDTVLNVGLQQNILWSFSYNANGDLTQKLATFHDDQIEWDYTYSVDGWLTKVERKVGGQTELTEEYAYDPIGRKYKVETTEDTESTERYFVYDGASILLELEAVGEGQDEHYELTKEYVTGLGGYLYTRDADEQTRYMHYDGSGNVVSITDEAREEVAYYEYDAWGNVLTACGDSLGEFRFQAQQASLGTGLIDFGYRWYDSSTGRWTQREPLGLLGGLNAYQYVYGNPTNLADTGGLRPFDPNDEYGGDPLRPIDSSDWDGSYNPLAGTMRVTNAGINGFFEGLGEGFDDLGRVIQGGGALSEIILGGILVCTGNPLGLLLIFDGADSLTEAIVEGAYGTDYRSFTEHAGDLTEKLGLPREVGEGAYSLFRLWCTLRGSKYLRARSGGTAAATGRGGRLGKPSTRAHVAQVADDYEGAGFRITGGGGRFPEEYIPGPGGARLGSAYVDITATRHGIIVRVNTVDTLSNGITPTLRELRNADKIRSLRPGDVLILIPKPK